MQLAALRTSIFRQPSSPKALYSLMALAPYLLAALLGAALILLAGCATTKPEEAPPATASPEPEPDADAIAALLEAAAEAFENDRLITPPGDNAYERLLAVLALDPDNPQAAERIARIVERYLEFAIRAAEQGYFPRARSMLDRARIAQHDHPQIQQLEETVALLAQAKRVRIALDRGAVAARDASASARLRNIGARAKLPNTRVTIVARSDAEGRWMYQQMREAPGERRIRAELTIGSPPSVELIELPCTDATC
jgi:hypothetical protein